MKRSLTTLALMLFAAPALADGYVMGAGRWPCGEVIRVAEGGTDSEVGQLAGWILGFWSAATLVRDTGFVDTVENAGGRAVFDATVSQCRKASPDTLLYILSQSMIDNTK